MKRRVCAWVLVLSACGPSASTLPAPWLAQPAQVASATRVDVRTLNRNYDRTHSKVLVREVDRPTRAALDYAAYHANFMIADAPPEQLTATQVANVSERPFAGALDRDTLTGDIARTPFGPEERALALAFAPLSEYLLAHKVRGADALAALGSAVRSETWGQPSAAGLAVQTVSEVFVHQPAHGPKELWVKVEFAPWFTGLGPLPDQDRDGYPEVYARARSEGLTPELFAAIGDEYAGRTLDPSEIKTWANQLSSYWYPSFNTDLVPVAQTWPDTNTEAAIKHELAGLALSAPTIVLRGKPDGQASYNVFVIKAATVEAGSKAGDAHDGKAALVLRKTQPSAAPERTAQLIQRELSEAGSGAWDSWMAKLAPFHSTLRKRLTMSPKAVKGFAGEDGYLFYRNGLEFVVGGDIEQQPAGKNPLPVIVAWKQALERLGVDFLFVPVPDKAEVFPEALDAKSRALAGHVVNPAQRKFLAKLAEQGVEVVDLLGPFLSDRRTNSDASLEPLYQHQDTHWSARGLELAAQLVAARVRQYPWYAELGDHARSYSVQDASCTRFGDLHSRLPEAQKARYQPEALLAHQVVNADGTPYEDDPNSPIVVLGDSFTSVYELTEVEHAGLSAHVARQVSFPVDLVMSYGGGPNVRSKLMRRGEEALAQKKLVIWVMADRDLYNYWEDWQAL